MYKTLLHFVRNVLLSFTFLLALCYLLILGIYLLIQPYSCFKHMVQSEMLLAVSDQFHILTLSCSEYMDSKMNGNTKFFLCQKVSLQRTQNLQAYLSFSGWLERRFWVCRKHQVNSQELSRIKRGLSFAELLTLTQERKEARIQQKTEWMNGQKNVWRNGGSNK